MEQGPCGCRVDAVVTAAHAIGQGLERLEMKCPQCGATWERESLHVRFTRSETIRYSPAQIREAIGGIASLLPHDGSSSENS
jgi:hypothetical protein